MAVLSRPKISPQQRFDLEDFLVLLSGLARDSKDHTKQFWAPTQFILKGFAVSGLNAPSPVSINVTDGTLINANNSGEFSFFDSEVGDPAISVALQANSRNYIELFLSLADGTPLPRAFWDPSADSGQGSEFQQTVNTLTSLKLNAVSSVGGFSGSTDRIQLAIVDTDNTNTVRNILDKRPLLFRLGQPGNPLGGFSWATQVEPPITVNLSSASGTFVAGETVTFTGGITATVQVGGTSQIKIIYPSGDPTFNGTVTGGTSGASGHVDSMVDAFIGADKDIDNVREMVAALMNEIRGLKGTNSWFEGGYGSIFGSMKFINSCISQSTTAVGGAKVLWNGSALSFTDSSGSPLTTDTIANIRIFSSPYSYGLRRQDAGAGGALSIADQQVLYVTLPNASQNFSGAGAGASNYKVVARSSFVLNDQNYWLAYREGSKLIVRGIGELQSGESEIIGDTVPQSVLNSIGLVDEASSPAYSSSIRGAAAESLVARAGTLTDAIGDEQEDRASFFRSDSPIVWSGTQLIFTSNIILECLNAKNGTAYNVTIPTSLSPLTVNNGDVIWFNNPRTTNTLGSLNTNSVPAQTQANKDVIILCKREDVSAGTYGEESDVLTQKLLYIPMHKQVLRDGVASYLGESGRGKGVIRVDYHDPISTTLPSGATCIIDGFAGVNGDLVVYSNLGSGNNRIYKLGGVGTSITWTAQYDFFQGLDPLDGEMVIVEDGTGFHGTVGRFDNGIWNFNKTLRFFTGADYMEMGAINTVGILNNTTTDVFTVTASGSENWVIHYSLARGLNKEDGTIYMTTDGATVTVTKVGPFLGSTGVTFFGDINAGNIRLRYTSDNSGPAGNMKLFTFRWSDAAGGPAGIPSYTAGTGATVVAAGNPGDIQFKDVGGGLAADSRFKINTTTGSVNLNGMEIVALQGPLTILDNQGSFQTLVSYNAATYKRAIIEYSITRNGEERTGRLMVATNGSVAGQSDDFVETLQSQATGVVLQAIFSGGNILVQYTSDNQSANGQFYFSMRRW